MGKIVQPAHIIGESGVIKFKEYCNKHQPFIIFREIKEHDYGVDGEIEIVKFVNDKQIASGQVIKVQLKSTAHQNSYIRGLTETGFSYYASEDDFDYWSAHNLGVILIIYDAVADRLFARKITREDYAYHKKHSKSKSFPIEFSFRDHELFVGEGTFYEKMDTEYFKPRIDTTVSEKLISNIQFFSSFPKKIFIYDTLIGSKKAVFDKLGEGMNPPPFIIYNKKIYAFTPLASNNKVFRENIIDPNNPQPVTLQYDDILADQPILNHYVELLNLYLKDFFTRDRRLWLNRKQKHNYFFPKPFDKDELKIKYKTRKRGTDGERMVVNYYEYGKNSFFRHFGFVYAIDFINQVPVFILNYKYHFTINGVINLSPLKITSFTNKLTAREFNATVINHLYFWFEYLSEGSYMIDIANNDDFKIRIKLPEDFTTDFGIYKSKNIEVAKPKTSGANDQIQPTLF